MAIVIDLMPGAYAPKRAVMVDADPARASGAPTNQWVDDGMIFWVLEPGRETELFAAIERAKVYADQPEFPPFTSVRRVRQSGCERGVAGPVSFGSDTDDEGGRWFNALEQGSASQAPLWGLPACGTT